MWLKWHLKHLKCYTSNIKSSSPFRSHLAIPSRFSHDDDSVFVFSWNKGLTPPVIELFDGYIEAWCCKISDGWLIRRLLRVIALPHSAIDPAIPYFVFAPVPIGSNTHFYPVSHAVNMLYMCSRSTLGLIADARNCYLTIINASQAIQNSRVLSSLIIQVTSIRKICFVLHYKCYLSCIFGISEAKFDFLIWSMEWKPDQFQVFVVYMCRQHKTLWSYNAKHTSPLIIANVGTSAQIADDK